MKKCIVTGLIFLGFLINMKQTFAQEIYGKPNIWFLLLTHYEFSEDWSVGNELHMRYDDYFTNSQQFLLRPFANYHLNENVIFSAGYTLIKTYPYGKYPLPDTKPEHNVWEQVTLNHKIGKLAVSHRYRLEQRWQGDLQLNTETDDYEVNAFDFGQRFRYRLTLKYAFHKRWFVNVFDELWIKGDGRFRDASMDRNWFYAALGFNITEQMNIQLAYLHQYIPKQAQLYERHHGLQLTADIRFKRKNKK